MGVSSEPWSGHVPESRWQRANSPCPQLSSSLRVSGLYLQETIADVPETIGRSLLCESVTPETVPSLYAMLDGIISQLQDKQTNQ